MEYNKSIDTTDFVYNTKTNGDPGRSGVTADFIKTISKNNTVSASSPVTADWLKKNRKSINDFVVNVDRNTISDFRKSLTDAESWQTQDKMDDTIRKTEVLYKSGLLDIGEKEYNEIINGLKNNKEIFGQFSEETYNMLKDMGGYLTYNEVQDSILRIKQSMSLSDDENHKRMLRKRLNFLENYQENVGFTDSGYYDEQIRQIKAKKQKLLDEQNVLALLKHTSPEYYKRHGEITDELGEVTSKLEELEAQRYTAKMQESVEENKKYFPRVETFFGLGEDDPLEKRLQAAYELKEMDKYMSRPDFQTVLADIGKVKEANAAGFYNDNAKGSDGFWDLNYLYVNRYMPEELQTAYKALQNFDEETLDMLFDSAHDAFSRLATSNMLQAERDVYNYIHATEGQEAATAFLDKYVKPRITGEIADEVREEAETLAKESPVAAWTLSVGNKALLEPIEGMTNLAHMAIDPEGYNENWVAHEQTFIQTNTIRQTQSEALGNIGGMIYNVGTGVVDLGLELATSKITSTYLGALGAVDKIGSLKSTANKATKGGQFYYTDKAAYDRITGWVKQTISSSKIAGETLSDARARGLSGTQAIGEALSMAAIEWATEHIGIDNLLKADASVIRTMISEGMEEGLSAIADPIVDAWIAGDKSKWKISVRNYINEGKNYNDAVSLAFRDVVGDVVYEAGLGALTGGVFKGSMKLVGNLFGNSQIPKSAVWIRTDTEKTKANASASIRKWGSITMKRNDVGDIYIDSKKQLSAVEASLTGQEAAAVASIRKVVRNGKVVNEHTEQGKALYRIAGAAEGDVVLYTPMRMVGDDRGALHSVAVRLSQAGAIGKYEVSGVILDGDVLLNLEWSVKSPLVMENESLYTGNTETDGTRYSLNGAVDNVDYDALEKYDSRTYANSGWVTVNRVLTGKELKKINSQFADAVANGFQYPKTSSGEIIITVGDADGDANKLVYISGTLENPIISKIVQINPSDTSDISAIRQNIIDMEVEGYVNIWDIVASVFGEEVFRIQSSDDFRSYRELKGARQDRQSNDFINRDHQQRNTGGRSGTENPAGDRGTVTDTGITEDSLASNDGPGTELYTKNEENPQQTEAQHMGSNGVRMQSVPTHDIKQENGASQNFQSAQQEDFSGEETTSINLEDKTDYPYNMQTVIQEYIDSTNEDVLQYAEQCREDKSTENRRVPIGTVSNRQAEDMANLLGVDFSGFENTLDKSALNHIEKRHGINGTADSSMSDLRDVARAGYILSDYDSVEITRSADGNEKYSKQFRDKNNDPAPLLKFTKKINGTYYAVVACPDSKWKKIWLVSAYITKNSSPVTQEVDVTSPNLNVQNGLASPDATTDSIPESSENVNSNAVRDRRAEIGVNPSEMDTIFNSMGEWQQQKVLTTLEKNTGTHILLDETLEADGEYDSATKTIRINPNRATPVTVIKHELTHFIENSGMLYQDLMNYAMKSRAFSEWLESKGYTIETIGDMRKELADRYAKHGEQLDVRPGASADQEILANFVAEKLFTDLDALCALKSQKPRLFNRFRAWLSRRLRGYKGTPVEKELRRMEQMFSQAVERAQGVSVDGQKKYSVQKDSLGNDVVVVDTDQGIFVGADPSEYSRIVRTYFNEHFKGVTLPLGNGSDAVSMSKKLPGEYAYPHTVLGKDTPEYRVKMKAITELDNLLLTAKNYYHAKDTKGNPEATLGWDYYDVEFLCDGMQVTGLINIANSEKGRVFYDITKIKVAPAISEKYVTLLAHSPSASQEATDTFRIAQNSQGVNTKYTQNGTKKFIAPDTTTETPGDQLTDAELLEQLRKRGLSAAQNPLQIAQLKPDDADTTPALRGNGNVNTKGDGESAFADSVQGASIFSDELKQLAAEDTNITRYDAITNKETMVAANKRINEGGKSFVEKLQNKGAEFYTSDDIAASIILISRYEKIGDHQSALFMLEKIREAGTIAGQTVQTLSLLSRLTPEGMLAYAQKELSQAYKAMVEGKTSKWIRDNADRFQLTDEDAEFILQRTWQAAQLPKGRDKNIRLAEIAERIRSKIPQEKGQAFKAWQRTAMLLNPKTQLRNIIGNATMAPVFVASDTVGSGIDALLSKATGVRTTARFQWSSVKGMTKGFFESYDDFLRHISTRDINADRFDIKAQSSKNFNEHHKGFASGARNNISKALNALDRFNSFLLEAGDRSFYEMWFINSLNGQMKTNKVTEPTAEMIEIATQDALQRTWQDDNSMTRSVSRLKHGLNDLFSIHGYGLGDVFIKFTKTPANLTKAMIDFSPVGLLKAISADAIRFTAAVKEGRVTPQMQRTFVKNLSNGITGTLMTALFAALASAGLVTGEQDEDKDVSAFERAVFGKQPYSFKIGNVSFSYDWAQPAAAHLAAMANFLQDKRNAELTGEEKIWYQSVLDAFKTGGKVLYNQSFMQSLQNLFADDDFITNALNGILSDASASVPQTLSQAASSLDPTVRTTYETGDDVQTAINKVLYKIPGARETLAPSVDVLGNERKQIENPVGRTLSSFLSPANISSGYDSVAGDEMYRLYQATGEASAIAPVAPNYVNSKKGTYTLTSKEKAEYQKITGQMSSKAVESLVNSKFYQELADEMKVKLLSSIYSYSKQVANNKVLGLPISESYEKAHKAISAGVPVEMYYLLKNTASSDGNDSVSQKEAKAALDASGLSREQKRIMWQSFNDSWKYNPYGSSGYKYY